MRILGIASSTGLSHIVRTLELARELRGAGHEVSVGLGDGEWRSLAHAYGFVPEATNEPELRGPLRFGIGTPTIQALRMSYESEVALIDKIRPELVISDWRFTAWASTRATSVPLVQVWNANWGMLAGYSQLVSLDLQPSYARLLAAWKPVFDAFRSELTGASCPPEEHIFRGWRNLIPDAPLFRLRQVPRDYDDVRWLGPLVPVPTDWAAVDRAFAARTLGIFFGGHKLGRLRGLLERAARKLCLQCVNVGADVSPTATDEHTGIRPFSFFPSSLAMCTIVASHGGAGSVYQSLMACKPVLALPQHLDQLDNASQLERLGIGICLPPERQTEEAIEEAVVKLSDMPQETLRSVALRLRGYHAAQTARTLIESAL
jgi:UDP:flavonoid glycosyltransferase YjiC (YdhE family)